MVDLIGVFLRNIVLGGFMIFFYQNIVSTISIKAIYKLIPPIGFSLYKLLTHDYIPEPLRSIIGIAIFGVLLWLFVRKINWAVLLIVFTFGYIAWLVALFIVALIGSILFGEEGHGIENFIMLIFHLATSVATYRLTKEKKWMLNIDTFEIKSIIFFSAGILLSVWGIFILTDVEAYDANLPLFGAGIIAIILVILCLVFLIIHQAKRHREKLAAEKQQQELQAQKQSLEELQHKYRTFVPAMGAFSGELLEQLKQDGNANYMEAVKA